MSTNKSKLFYLLAMLLFTQQTHASTVAQELTRINEQTALLNARDKQLEVEERVRQRQINISGGHQSLVPVLPIVLGIEGLDGKFAARIALGGAVFLVKKGEKIRDGIVISQINVNAVEITHHGKRYFLPVGYAEESPTPNSANGASAATILPR